MIRPDLNESSAAGTRPQFPLGAVVATPGAVEALTPEDMLAGLRRHAAGDWGEICVQDRDVNNAALIYGNRLLSAYTGADGTVFWIITEWDRSVTTVLLPSEY